MSPTRHWRRPDQEQYGAALGHLLAVEFGVTRDVSPDVRPRRLVTQDLLDGVGDQRVVRGQLAPLLGMLGEQLAGPADQPIGGLVARAGEHIAEDDHFLAGEPPPGARFIRELGGQQLGHQVVRGDRKSVV